MTAPAIAADLSPRPVKAPAMVAAAYNWTGFYVGVHGGGWNKFTGNRPDGSDRSGSSANGSGAVVGGQIGGNYQIGQVVLGLEGPMRGPTSRSATVDRSAAARVSPSR